MKHFLLIFIVLSSLNLFAQPGKPDTTFNTLSTFGQSVLSTIIQEDGKIVVAGKFSHYRSKKVGYLVRLNSDGSLDNTFKSGTGADNEITSILLLPDNKLMIVGNFTSYDGTTRGRIARLNPDGSLDNTFNPSTGANDIIHNIILYGTSQFIISGRFNHFNGTRRNFIARINQDGTLDQNFTSPFAMASIKTMAEKADGKILLVASSSLIQLNANGTIDHSYTEPEGFYAIDDIKILADGKTLVGGWDGLSTGALIRLNSDGTRDITFNEHRLLNGGIRKLNIFDDGKIIFGGFLEHEFEDQKYRTSLCLLNKDGNIISDFEFNSSIWLECITILNNENFLIGGHFRHSSNNHLIKINIKGKADAQFNFSPGPEGQIAAISKHTDGKILIAGRFNHIGNERIPKLARLNSDGTIDRTFKRTFSNTSGGPYCMKVLENGKILLGGGIFLNTLTRLMKINEDGSVDNTFNILNGNSMVESIDIQSDGKIIAGGLFTSLNNTDHNYVVRLDPDGTIDQSFLSGLGANNRIFTVAIQDNDKIILGGDFTDFNGFERNRIVRLNSDGSVDENFNPGTGFNNRVNRIQIQPDGKILVAGSFTTYNQTNQNRLVRLNPDGSIDENFNTGSGLEGQNLGLRSLELQEDGKILIGGVFTSYNGFPAKNIARLNSDGSYDVSFDFPNISQVNAICISNDGIFLASDAPINYNGIGYNGIVKLFGEPSKYNLIRGKIIANNTCQRSSTPRNLPAFIVKAEPGPYYASSNNEGDYILKVDSGNKSLQVQQLLNPLKGQFISPICPANSHQVSLTGADMDICCHDFVNEIKNCAMLSVNIQSNRRRRCFRNNTYVTYANEGLKAANNVQVKVEFPEYVIPISSTPTWTRREGNILYYDLNTLNADQKGKINIVDSVVCWNEGIRGMTQCTKATITPKNDCVSESTVWDRSSMKVTGTCKNNQVVFTIINSGSGHMNFDSEYRVYINDTLIYQNPFKLNSGESFEVTVNSGGKTVRLEADQHPEHPGKSRPRSTVERCGTLGTAENTLASFVATAPLDNADSEVAESCLPIIDSYDPNDKLALPKGISAENYIRNEENIDYTIRFQNTGTDTAFTVVIVDTLDSKLDIATFIPGISSHNYVLEVTGKERPALIFTFNNILLPDSTTNEPASNGFIKFSISPLHDLPIGTVINNDAGIYFDFNSPIITNTYHHTIYDFKEEDFSRQGLVEEGEIISSVKKNNLSVSVSPNPTSGLINVQTDKHDSYLFRVFNLSGEEMLKIDFIGSSSTINIENLYEGMYLYKLESSHGLIGTGKVVKK
ncbi:MAG: T9SS type A sorting domain-containing protein [Cytophagaceae bacterium]